MKKMLAVFLLFCVCLPFLIFNASADVENISFRSGSKLSLTENGYIVGALPGYTEADLLKQINNFQLYRVEKTENGNVLINNKTKAEYPLIVPGDIDGNGDIDSIDVDLFIFQKLFNDKAEDNLHYTADINQNGRVTTADYLMLKRHASEKSDIFLKYQPFKEDNIMTFEKTSDIEYKLTYTADNGDTFTQTIDKKTWSTWNIGTLRANNTFLAGGGTDWEYVFRAADSNSKNWVWSGGNHGNELLVDLKFYDDITGEEIILEKGQKIEINGLRMVENTQLHWGNSEVTYADVTRYYVFNIQKTTLDVAFNFTKDCYFYLSYTCMFPVDKAVGLYCRFNNDDGTEFLAETKPKNKSDDKMYKENKASSCYIYGLDNPKYTFLVEVFTREDSLDNFKNFDKTFYWDMNNTTNKLYFSRFNEPSAGAITKIDSGTVWNTSSAWTFFTNEG